MKYDKNGNMECSQKELQKMNYKKKAEYWHEMFLQNLLDFQRYKNDNRKSKAKLIDWKEDKYTNGSNYYSDITFGLDWYIFRYKIESVTKAPNVYMCFLKDNNGDVLWESKDGITGLDNAKAVCQEHFQSLYDAMRE